MSATDYFRRNCWISTECDDRFVADVMRWMGDDHIVFETDFPHPDSKYPKATEHFLALEPELIADEQQAQGPVGQRRRPLPLPRGLPAECRDVTDASAGRSRRSTTGGDRASYPPPPEYFETAWLDDARGDRAHAAGRACARGR